ncbi:hypothetical protein BEWA_035820 [Theileria equi strain WA]|uniref:Serine aminopeptidase S33 domain-containing protein n=1 Tax=Theileria equi strain WA TaxID=1537102 RepID=L1LDW7_THEEQ|nr:hypothetical protein BEWA_035820 [Theileria equi strain WA]EKX73546.1 hypothetical protein BEWA_035820 [Theileria equi strain WA]|eukprot:XP_004832998.1 hypothetical protein BEWA_035820 [Theileria equi strain WA]
MFSLESRLRNIDIYFIFQFLKRAASSRPESMNKYEGNKNYGASFEVFMRYVDPFFYPHRLTYKTVYSLLTACIEVNKDENMVHYPKDLPTLLIHSKWDRTCDIKGPKDICSKIGKSCKLVDLNSTCHYLLVAQISFNAARHIMAWLSEHG